MKKKLTQKERDKIGLEIKSWILSKSSVSRFCRDHEFATSTMDNWLAGNRSPSLMMAIRLEVISGGKLKKETLCPQYNW